MRSNRLKILLVPALCVAALLAGSSKVDAQAWSNGYSSRRAIAINHAKVPNTDQANFPVLISGTYADLATAANGGNVANANGSDIIFTSDPAGTTVLAFEQESYSQTTGQINYWVKVPSLSSSVDTVIFMFYGNSSVTSDQSNKNAVWSNGYVGVWHMPNGTALTTSDSTSLGNNATNVNSVSAAIGKIGGGGSFNGSNSYLDVGNPSNLQSFSAVTTSIWVNTTHLNGTAQSIFIDKSTWPSTGFQLTDHGPWSTNILFIVLPGGNGGTCDSNGFVCFPRSLINDGNWHQVTGVYDPTASTVSIYLDGSLKASRASGTFTPNTATPVSLGQFGGGIGPSGADEFRISNAVRSADWIAAEYNNESNPATFISIGASANSTSSVPTIISLSLAYSASDLVTISGTNFGSSQGSSSAMLNGITFAPTSWSATSVVVPAPYGLTNSSATVVLTVGGVASNALSFTLRPQQLTTPWLDQDVGTVGIVGSGGYAGDIFTVMGSGAAIGSTTDGMNFAYQSLSGDGTIISRMTAMNNGGYGNGQAGVMIRETLNANSAYAFLTYYSPYHTLFFYNRSTAGGNSSSQQYSGVGSLPAWMKLVRSGNSFTAFASQDGMNWTQVGSTQTISMAANVYVGLASSSADNSWIFPSAFDNVSVSTSSSSAPVISAVTATTGSIGSQVVISGYSFGSTQNGSAATLNGTPVTINSWSDTAITFTIPLGATSGPLKVTVSPSFSDSNFIDFTVESNPIPNPWLDLDIGNTTPMGGASYAAGTFTVQGSGAGTGSTADAVHFAYLPLSGDGVLIARLVSLQNGGNGGPNAGLMIRESLDPAAVNVFLNYFHYSSSANVASRYTTGAVPWTQQLSGSVTLPYWFQLVRSGSSFTAYGSSDGSTWTQIVATQTITMASNSYVGLAVDSSANPSLVAAVFDNVSVTPVSGTLTPSVASITPNAGLVGTSVVLAGSNFGPTQSSSTVTFSGVTAAVTSWTATALTVTVPSGAITGDVVLSVGGFSTAGVNFSVEKMPTIASLSPTSGGYGTAVTIAGTNYGATQGTSVISFNGTNATSIASWSDTQVVALVPTGTTTGPVSAIVNTVTSTTHPTFTNYNPVITSITPPAAQPGSTVTINGSGFNGNAFNIPISFNGVSAAAIQWTDTSITIGVPPSATSGLVNATVGGITSNSVQFSVLEPLTISSISPISGPVGTSVTVTGAGFGATQSTSTVTFFGLAGTATSWSDTQIVVTVPRWATTGPVQVGVAGGMYFGQNFSTTFEAIVTDSLGNSSTYISQDIGGQFQLTSATGSGCSTCTVRGVVTKTYDSNGNALTSTDELGHTTTIAYDSNNNVLTTSQPVGSSTATTSYTYNSFGEVLTATDPLGHVTTNTYDANANLLTVTSPAPASGVAASVTQFAYNSLGELTQITDPLGHVSTMTYTTAGLIATITDAQSNVTTYAYDAHGNRTSVTDAASHVTTFDYDAGERLTTITYPPAQSGGSSTTSTFAYDSRGRRTSATDQNGKTTSYAYDTADRLTTVTDAASNVTTYTYDTENNLLGITDANSHTTNFTYDAFGRVTQTTFPSSFYESYAYDAIGNLTSKTDRKGQTIQYVYDALNRLTQKNYPDSTSAAYTYDLASRIQQVNDPTGTYAFAYDNMGRLIGTTTNYSFLSGTTFTNAYTYDANSNRTGYTAPDGSTNTYTYDTLNRLTTLANSWAGSFGFSYDALGRRTQMTRPNGVNTNYSFDSLSRLLSVLHQNGASTIDGASYTVDATGNRTSKTDQLAGVTSNYAYDALYELTQVTQAANTTESYTYDPVSNRKSSLMAATSSYNASNQLTSNSNATFTYDANGNTASKADSTGTTSYSWDFENRLTSVTLPGTNGTVSFKYDPAGRRIQKIFGQGSTITTTNYVYDGKGPNLLQEVDGNGNVTARYAHGRRIDEPLAEFRSGIVSYYEADGMGSTSSVTNGAGSLTNTYAYDSFGNTTNSMGTAPHAFRYTGREFDPETGIYFYRARYYDAAVGRFISEDPIEFNGGINFFNYVFANPINYRDPSGQTGIPIPAHGAWCGPNWTGGRLEEYDPGRDKDGYYAEPIDSTDYICKEHDICYHQCRATHPCDPGTRGQCMRYVCDARFIADAPKNLSAAVLSSIMAVFNGHPDAGENAKYCPGCSLPKARRIVVVPNAGMNDLLRVGIPHAVP